jgi:hypothetical protein
MIVTHSLNDSLTGGDVTKALSPAQQLSLISKAWGKQEGYCFFPYIDGRAKNREERIKSYREGPAFAWPEEKAKILDHFRAHTDDDLYWCPSLFERQRRITELAMDEHALWADLDEVDPRGLTEFPPTIAWESSPGRYQALWLITGGDLQGASWQGGENHRLTYYIGADPSGWDTTQLLRIPGWKNHKFEYRKKGVEAVQGRLLWSTGRRYLPDEFEDLPEVQRGVQVEELLEDEIDSVDRQKIYGEIRLKLPHRCRELFSAKEYSGDRSETLWWMMRCLADVGCTVTQIVALVRPTVWNKFEGRQDEMKRLVGEASKAIAQRDPGKSKELEAVRQEYPEPGNLFEMVKNVKQPEWIVNQVLSVGSCGFIAGQPKTWKSWFGLDLALSVSGGLPFLNHFVVRKPGPGRAWW